LFIIKIEWVSLIIIKIEWVSSPGHESILASEVPLAVLNEEVEGEEEGREGQEEEEAVVEVSVADAVDVPELPREGDDLGVQSEGHA